MKCQIPFSGKYKKNYFKMSSDEILPRVLHIIIHVCSNTGREKTFYVINVEIPLLEVSHAVFYYLVQVREHTIWTKTSFSLSMLVKNYEQTTFGNMLLIFPRN